MNELVKNEVLENYKIYENVKDLKEISKKTTLIFLCVGNSKIWYDSFGPIFGSLLKLLNFNYYIYGNLKSNINANNIEDYIDMIYKFHEKPFIIVIDNAISNEEIPKIKIINGSINCAVFSKKNILVGDMGILYCLNKKHLQNLNNYNLMLKDIARMILFVFNKV